MSDIPRSADNPKGATIAEMDATDLVGRMVFNANGAPFRVKRLVFDAKRAAVTIWIEQVDDEGNAVPWSESGLYQLNGWTIGHKS